jgi:hypothetical protein
MWRGVQAATPLQGPANLDEHLDRLDVIVEGEPDRHVGTMVEIVWRGGESPRWAAEELLAACAGVAICDAVPGVTRLELPYAARGSIRRFDDDAMIRVITRALTTLDRQHGIDRIRFLTAALPRR